MKRGVELRSRPSRCSFAGFGGSRQARRGKRLGQAVRARRDRLVAAAADLRQQQRTSVCSSSFGSRQKASNAASNSACCSWRSSITALSAACTSSRRSSPTCSIAAIAASTRSGPIGIPALRSTRAKWTMFSAITACTSPRPAAVRRIRRRHSSNARARSSSSSFAVSPLCSLTMSSWYFSSTPSVSCTVAGSSADRVQRDQRVRPVDRLGDARRLEQVERAHALHELDHLHVEPLRRARRLQPHDLELALDAREIDPVVQAAPLQRVVDLARAVAGDDRDRRRAAPHGAELGNR